MSIFQDDYGTITHDKENGILTLTWSEKTADMHDENFQNSNLALAILADEHKIEKLIVDVEKFRHKFGPELGGWRERNVLPIYARAGVKKFAFVHGGNYGGPLVGGMDGESFKTHHYNDVDDAIKWLNE